MGLIFRAYLELEFTLIICSLPVFCVTVQVLVFALIKQNCIQYYRDMVLVNCINCIINKLCFV